MRSHLAIPFIQRWNTRSLLATSFDQYRNTRSLLAISNSLESHLAIPFIQYEIWGPFWRPPLTNIEIRDPFWRSPLIKNQKIYFVNRSTWNPIWRFPLTDCSMLFFLMKFIYLFIFKVLLVIPESKPWFFAIINSVILSSSTILLDYIKDFSCNDSKNIHAMIYD